MSVEDARKLPANPLGRLVHDQPPGTMYPVVNPVLHHYVNPRNFQSLRIEEFMTPTRHSWKETLREFARIVRNIAAVACPGLPVVDGRVLSHFNRGQPQALWRLLMANSYSSIKEAIGSRGSSHQAAQYWDSESENSADEEAGDQPLET